MVDSSIEATREFLRFRDQGDPEAMARVFDLVAPKLLLLAMHLAKDTATAEDLVQTTFLQAIEGADKFDSEYPSVMPWLSQILRRRAQDVHRKVERESRLLSAHQPVQPRSLDPQANLEREEAAKDFEEALDSLPEKYRSVLILRLVQGMEPKDIGYSLGIDSGTVRTQLKRGLEWLRQRMRYGATLSIAISMIATRGMADVRRVVMDRALLEQPLVPWWTQVALRHVAAVLVTAAVVAGSAWMLVSWDGATIDTEVASARIENPGTVPTSQVDASKAVSGAKVSEPARVENQDHSQVTASTSETRAGRLLSVVWVNDGLPAAHAPLTLRRSDLGRRTLRQALNLDGRGKAEISHLSPGIYDVHHYGFGKQYLTVPDDSSPVRLELDGGSQVVGQLIDEAGSSLAGARIWTSGSVQSFGRFVGVVDDDGHFESEHAAMDQLFVCQLADGRWSEARVMRGTPDPVVEFELRVKALTIPVRGLVTRTDGEPIAGATVDVRTTIPMVVLDTHARLPHHPRRVKTDEDGRFELLLPADAGPVRFQATKLGYAPKRIAMDVSKASGSVRIGLEASSVIHGRITDEQGQGLANASVRAMSPGRLSFEVVSDADGRYRLRGLPTAEWHMVIDAGARGRAEQRVRLGDRDRSVEIDHVAVVIEGVRGSIVDASGRPAGGLIVLPLTSLQVAMPSVTSDVDGRFFIPLSRNQFDSVLIQVRTDTPPVALHVVGSETLHIALGERSRWSPTSYVKGSLIASDDPSLRLRIEHHSTDWSRSCAWSPTLGTFRVGPLPPGGYDLVVSKGAEERLRIPVQLGRDREVDLGMHRVK